MVKIIFRNSEQVPPGEKVFTASGVSIFRNSIVARFDSRETLLATGQQRRWRVGLRLYTSVEIQAIEDARKAA